MMELGNIAVPLDRELSSAEVQLIMNTAKACTGLLERLGLEDEVLT